MRLIDELAANRCYYHRPLATLPDILLIDIPLRFSGGGLALGRYYPVILESLAEMHEFEAYLCEPRMTLIAPALLDRRPSGLRTSDIIFARYEPQISDRSEEHTSELQSLMRISYAVFCLKKNTNKTVTKHTNNVHTLQANTE